jgi:hypothetical protein
VRRDHRTSRSEQSAPYFPPFAASSNEKGLGECPGPVCIADLQPAEIAEFLHALALHFSSVDVAFAVDGKVVQVVKFAGVVPDAAEGGDVFAVGAVEQMEFPLGSSDVRM